MALWVVRAGRYGDQQVTALSECVVVHGWNELPDYSYCATRDELRLLYEKTYPLESQKQVSARFSQVWRFAHDILVGDIVALPMATESSFTFGKVIGDYRYQRLADNVMHVRSVEWLKTIPRSSFPKDILFTMNGALTIFKVSRNDAESRVRKIIDAYQPNLNPAPAEIESITDEELEDETVDLAKSARDEILKFVQDKFKTHDLTHLVGAVLRAQGFKTEISPAGPDGGVDILAGSGPLGFDKPRLAVQVKSGGGASGQSIYNELLGVMSKFDAQQGLLVSWGGFTSPVKKDSKKDFYRMRLWDQGDLVDAILEYYDRLDDDIKAELPLKKIWVMVNDDVE